MITKIPWFDRKFHFTFPIGVFPCILERLRGTPPRLEDLVRTIPKDLLIVRPDNKWSIQEHIGHLLALDELHEARIEDFLSGATSLRPADLKNRKTTDANYNAMPVDTILQEFRNRRAIFVHKLEEMTEDQLALISIHPRVQQSMRVIDMAYFVAEHDDHHIASMREVERSAKGGR